MVEEVEGGESEGRGVRGMCEHWTGDFCAEGWKSWMGMRAMESIDKRQLYRWELGFV